MKLYIFPLRNNTLGGGGAILVLAEDRVAAKKKADEKSEHFHRHPDHYKDCVAFDLVEGLTINISAHNRSSANTSVYEVTGA